MKTELFFHLLSRIAKAILPEAEYAGLKTAIRMRRWQQFRKEHPELWEWFSEKYDSIKDTLSSNSDPEEVIREIVPGEITRYPEIFQPFMQDLAIQESAFSSYPMDFSEVDLTEMDPAVLGIPGIHEGPSSSEIPDTGGIEGGLEDGFDILTSFVFGLLGIPQE